MLTRNEIPKPDRLLYCLDRENTGIGMALTAPRAVEWITLGLIVGCYAAWAGALFWLSAIWLPLGFAALVVLIALHSSLTHEMVHGHPFQNALVNEALGFACLGLFVPYRRFRDLHLAHHQDCNLTDPYEDPESNYLDPKIWAGQAGWHRALMQVNNTLLGRMSLGPAIGIVGFARNELRLLLAGDRAVIIAWLLQVPSVLLVLSLVWMSAMPVWLYIGAAYCGWGLIKIRTFLEHRAHERASGRTVIIEDRGPLAFLFLNNNLHVVHHMHPKVAWYDLPALYQSDKARYRDRNDNYIYRSYAEIFRQYFVRAKDPVPHPLWPRS